MSTPVMVLNTNTKREQGRRAQLSNIAASKAVADIIRTTLGPKSMLKMILDPMGGITMTNDGNAILREVDVSHPAAKSMIELSRTQDEEVGDGTTSVIILAGELLSQAAPWLEANNLHPRDIVGAYMKALEVALKHLEQIAEPLDVEKEPGKLLTVVNSCLGTKFGSQFGDRLAEMAIEAVHCVTRVGVNGDKEIDTKRYARVEKIPGGFVEQSEVLKGLILNKDVVHGKMRRRIVNPRILLLDCPLEFKKGESQTMLEISSDADWAKVLKQEEEYIENVCNEIIKHKPDLVFTEKGCADLAQHYLMKANISVLRRLRKSDNNRIARAVGATIVHRPEEIREADIGTGCGLFEVKKIGDEYFSYLVECKEPKACSIVLRGGSKDVLNEMERNLLDAIGVVRNLVSEPRLVPGGGSAEMSMAQAIRDRARLEAEGVRQKPFEAVGRALEIIPRTLIDNCGASPVRLLTDLRAKHAAVSAAKEAAAGAADQPEEKELWGIDGNKGELADMRELGIWEPLLVKSQTLKTAIEAACMLLRIDDIVSGISSKEAAGGAQQ